MRGGRLLPRRPGFELKADLGTGTFLAAGGYHHHVGVNVWNGQGATVPPAGTVGLRRWIAQLPSAADVDAVAARAGTAAERVAGGLLVRDPWGTTVLFTGRV